MENVESKECIYNGGIVMGVDNMEWCKLTGGYCGGAGCYMFMDTNRAIRLIESCRSEMKDEPNGKN